MYMDESCLLWGEKAHFHSRSQRSEYTYASAIYYQMDLVSKAMHFKAKHVIHLKSDPTILDTGDFILP